MTPKHYLILAENDRIMRLSSTPETPDSDMRSVEVNLQQMSEVIALLRQKKKIAWRDGAPVAMGKTITKRELVDKLIAMNKATEFNALVAALPLDEKLRWDASPTIAPDYPFIVQGRAMILSALGITGEQFDSIFH
jgi:hypothetical protein